MTLNDVLLLVSRFVNFAENSCIRYCLGRKDRSHIEKNEIGKINRLPVSKRVDLCLAVTAYSFKNTRIDKSSKSTKREQSNQVAFFQIIKSITKLGEFYKLYERVEMW